MHIEECLSPLADPDPVSEYVIRVWTPGATALAAWSLAQWTLTGAASVEDAIAWARAHGDGRPTEVLLIDPSGGVLRLWGAPPEEMTTTVHIPLTRD
ncbi:hypothetical protein [Brachybacterium saurashtrense]|uniref:Uncharacterized protein n=1 Tax=Brachybacterium saurashtrense TaxID=556288 RepID=A0A345YLF2_9MICO|nr:hypothetical protein [Brachybacterium saurashtrense]AXK44754.1 hypothetical protein DWV08_03330 [Brachybacterium saurashtrense]RRR23366.1 hypothetical protein DXU92_08465 [Brachybacterium saurashtrense]